MHHRCAGAKTTCAISSGSVRLSKSVRAFFPIRFSINNARQNRVISFTGASEFHHANAAAFRRRRQTQRLRDRMPPSSRPENRSIFHLKQSGYGRPARRGIRRQIESKEPVPTGLLHVCIRLFLFVTTLGRVVRSSSRGISSNRIFS